MGLRKSKLSKTSYDVSPVDKDFSNENDNDHAAKPQAIRNDKKIQKSPEIMAEVESKPEPELETAPAPVMPQQPAPAWIKQELFIDILKENIEDFEEIENFVVKPGMATGENYATLMLRVNIDVLLKDKTSRKVSYMMKVPHDSEQMRQMMSIANFFTTETGAYFDIMPEVEQMYRDAGCKDMHFVPKAFKLPVDDSHNYVLMEDLGPRGFKNTRREECLDLEHTKLALKKLAQMHAATAYRVATKGPYPSIFMEGLYGEKAKDIMTPMFLGFRDNFLRHLRTYKDGDKYYDEVKNYMDNMIDDMMRMFMCDESEFKVLNHGDCWSNNILFQYGEDGQLRDLHFVDFQNPKFGSPAMDLIYFMISSIRIDIKFKHFDFFIRHYHDNLIDSLKLLKYPQKLPTLRDLHIDIFDKGSWALMTSIMTLPAVLLDRTENASFENFFSDDENGMQFKNALYSNKKYRTYIEEILPWLYNRGFLHVREPKPLPSAETETPKPVAVAEKTDVTLTPEWVNETYFVDILKDNVEGYASIEKFEVSPATNAGDNYASLMLKVDIDVKLKDDTVQPISYMLKVNPVGMGEELSDLFNIFNTFGREEVMYNEAIPQLEEVYHKTGVNVNFGPKTFKFSKNPGCNNILMENKRPQGYKNADRLVGLDMEHMKCVLAKLSQFHAASACVHALNGDYPDILMRGMYCEEGLPMMERFENLFFDNFMDVATTYKGFEEFGEKLRKTKKLFVPEMLRVNVVRDDKFNVLNHGDCWLNNILFKYDASGRIQDTCFVDFQMCKYGSPAQDLYYFIFSSAQLDIKFEKFDYFVRYYHDELKKNLDLLQYPKEVPTLKQLHEDLLDFGIWGGMTTFGVMTVVLLDPTDNANMQNMMSDNEESREYRRQMYTNPRYRRHAEDAFIWLNRRGLLDYGVNEVKQEAQSLLPAWIDESQFNVILKDEVKDFEKILGITAAPGSKTGDNFASRVLRVTLDVQLKDGSTTQTSYIVKTSPPGEMMNAVVDMWNFFPKENAIYSEYLNELEAMLAEAGHEVVFGPKFYKLQNPENSNVLVMEDLRQRDFKLADRLQGLNMEHTKAVLRKMAQLHAASARRVELKGPYPETFNEGLYTEKTVPVFEQSQNSTNRIILDVSHEYEGNEEYKDKLEPLLKKSLEQAVIFNAVDPNEFNVLNHGDSWINNIMFQYDNEGSIKDTYFIDFQVCKYGSPAIDLHYFLMSSTELSIKVSEFDYLIRYYHNNLRANLSLLKYAGKIPSLRELQMTLVKYGFLAFHTFIGVGAVCLLDPTEKAVAENFGGDTAESKEFLKLLYGNERYKAHAAIVLPWLNKRGFLDV